MYTQCPECAIAFKVTADVLKQAAGMVRCGGCGNAFNSLAFLSESMPEQADSDGIDSQVPELQPESDNARDGLPKSISAEQSAALLKTLDELAGSDIRIEDTGVEWRVLDEDESAAPSTNNIFAADASTTNALDFSMPLEPAPLEFGSATMVDEQLDASATPVDEFLTRTPEVVDSPEIFDADANEFGKTSVDELRFDDNTPLPDDFDLDNESSYSAPVEPSPAIEEPFAAEAPSTNVEFDLSEPEEWSDILDEFEDLGAAFLANAEEETSTEAELDDVSEEIVEDALAVEDSAPEPTESQQAKILDVDTQFALQAEEMGIDLSGMNKVDTDLVDELVDVVDELGDDDEDADVEADGFEAELEIESEAEDEDELLEDAEADTEAEPDLFDELALEDEDDDEAEAVDTDEELALDDEDEDIAAEAEESIAEEYVDDTDDDDIDEAFAEELDHALEEQTEPVIENHTIEQELASLYDDDEVSDSSDSEEDDSPVLPPMTEEEHTVNMQIDQDLMALAIEDKDGFASTIIIPEEDAEIKARDELGDGFNFADDDDDEPDINSGFETIIMEGEVIRSALDEKKKAADVAEAAKLVGIAKAAEEPVNDDSFLSKYKMVGAAALLGLVLLVQLMHQSREALATMPGFNNTVGQIYRVLGQPVQPAWDITGWRFEATTNDTEGQIADELRVYSRVGNKSEAPLPYPLIGISLTDRFEETIGSRILDPADYLPSNLDPRKLVEPGETFEALISIDSTSEDATGFRLKACYRLTDGQLSCAMSDFK